MLSTQAEALLRETLVKSAHIGEAAEKLAEMAVDLATESSMALESLQAEERRVSAGYMRRAPSHRSRQPKPQPEAIDDNWIATGRTA